jgi:hypothetical protein
MAWFRILAAPVSAESPKKADGKIYKIDTIEHEGKLWIVPDWSTTHEKDGEPQREYFG